MSSGARTGERTRSALDDRLDALTGKKAPSFEALGLRTVGDLLRRQPRRYMSLSVLTDLSQAPLGEQITVVAEVESVTTRAMKQRKGSITEVVVVGERDQRLYLTFFNQRWREQQLKLGRRAAFTGKLGTYKGHLQLAHPGVVHVNDEPLSAEVGGDDWRAAQERPIPIYNLVKDITQQEMSATVTGVLDVLGDVPDPIPDAIRERHDLLPLRAAFEAVHRPRTPVEWGRGQHRLRWDEALVLQTELVRRRVEARNLPAIPRRPVAGGLLEQFDERLPFTLTGGQRSVGEVIAADLATDHPMHRLLQGEVGTGKTVVALRAMLAVIDGGGQAALLAPTEVLAQQHHRSLSAMLGPLAEAGFLGGADVATRIVLLTGSMGAAPRKRALLDAASGAAGIVVGTHALLEERVQFAELGLVVVDEQHRFGVEQRDLLRAKGRRTPHLLVMTATPIPRTIAMTVFGDLDISTLAEQPAGRGGVDTYAVPALNDRYMQRTWARVRDEVAAGHQAFIVCPQISGVGGTRDEDAVEDDRGEAELDDVTAAEVKPTAVLDLAPELVAGPLAGLRVEILHGRMEPEEKDDVMQRFGAGAIDVLIATTVVEVGVDVPNATAMVIMDANRFGISQLHQLRGRVARGSARGVCLLVTAAGEGTPGWQRVDTVAKTNDGFELAEADLEQRREGDVLGRSQSGWRTGLQQLRVLRDQEIISDAREEAIALLAADPDLRTAPALAAELAALAARDRTDFIERS